MIKYLIVLLIMVLALASPVAAVDITNLSATSGETWIRWDWDMSPLTPINGFLIVEVNGAQKLSLNLTSTPEQTVPLQYYLTNLQPNEKHSIRVYVLDNSTSPPNVPATAIVNMEAKTTQPGSYNTMIFILSLVLLGSSLALTATRAVIISLLLAITSGVLSLYVSTAVYQTNSSFSTVCTIVAILAGALIVYMLWWSWEDHRTWRD